MNISTASSGAKKTKAKRSSRPRWHRIYYLLAFFDVLVVSTSLYLGHQIMGIYANTVAENQEWAERRTAYSKLGLLAGAVDAPGNDVFDSHDVAAESEKMHVALTTFKQRITVLQDDMRAEKNQVQLAPVYEEIDVALNDIEAIQRAMAEMTEEAELIFSHFRENQPELAGQRMATMDRKYAYVITELARLHEDVGEIQKKLFDKQQAAAASLHKFEYAIATFIFLMVGGAVAYGHKIKEQLDLDTQKLETLVQERTAALATANEGLQVEIAERRRAEENLKKSERQLADAQQIAHIGSWDWDIATGRVTWSDELYRINGLQPQEFSLTSKTFLKGIHPDDLATVNRIIKRALQDHQPFDFDYRIICPDAGIRTLHSKGEVITDDAGRPLKMIGTGQDITEHKRIEQSLRESERRYRLVSELTSDYAYAFQIEPHGRTVRQWTTAAFARITGYAPEEFDARGWEHLYHPDDRAAAVARLRGGFTGRPYTEEFRTITKSGEVRWLRNHIRPIPDAGGNQIMQVYGAAQDITESKHAEERLKNFGEQLRALSAHLQSVREEERTHISREIHDELGQLLTGIVIDLSWLEDHLSDGDNEAARPLLEKTKSMLELADQVIDTIRRIATELRPGLLDDFGLAAAVEWYTREFQKRTGIDCDLSSTLEDIKLPSDISIAVFRVLQEALTNVARHARATRVDVILEEDDHHVILQVQDNGRGAQGGELSDTKSLGILGMRERMFSLGGEFDIASTQGRGTSVTARIPVRLSQS